MTKRATAAPLVASLEFAVYQDKLAISRARRDLRVHQKMLSAVLALGELKFRSFRDEATLAMVRCNHGSLFVLRKTLGLGTVVYNIARYSSIHGFETLWWSGLSDIKGPDEVALLKPEGKIR